MPAPSDPKTTRKPPKTNQKHGKDRKRTTLNTIAFDSAGPRKYAAQLQRAANGNLRLKIVEGIPADPHPSSIPF